MNKDGWDAKIWKALTTRSYIWTALFIFNLCCLGFVVWWKFILPRSVCICGPETVNQSDGLNFGKPSAMIKFRDFGPSCNEVCLKYGLVWGGVEMPHEEFKEMMNNLTLTELGRFNVSSGRTRNNPLSNYVYPD